MVLPLVFKMLISPPVMQLPQVAKFSMALSQWHILNIGIYDICSGTAMVLLLSSYGMDI